MKYCNSIENDTLTVFADASLFSKEAILKTLYWYGDKFHINVGLMDQQVYSISLSPLSNRNMEKDELELYLQKLERDLIDYQLRDTISKETQNVRDLLVAKAFSSGEFDEDPPGEVTDPIGFKPIEVNQTFAS